MSEVLLTAIVMIIIVVLTVGVLFFLVPSSTSQHSTLSTVDNSTQTITHINLTGTSNPSCQLWSYPTQFNKTIVISNSTILYSSTGGLNVSLPAHGALYLGFTLSNSAHISGKINASSPINLEVIRSNGTSDVFPVSSNDTVLVRDLNSSDSSFFLPSGISGTIAAGNYAIIFENPSGSQVSLTTTQDFVVLYKNCF